MEEGSSGPRNLTLLIGDSWRIPPHFSLILPLQAPSDSDSGLTVVRDALACAPRGSYTAPKQALEFLSSILNMQDKVGYAIGKLKTGRNPGNADKYLAYLATDDAQNIYAKYRFVPASAEEGQLKALPAK